MEFSYSMSKPAIADYNNIISYISVQLASPKAAAAFADKFQNVVSEIRTFPESGSLVKKAPKRYKQARKKIIGNYIVFYMPDFAEENIVILRIIYGKQKINPKDIFKL